MIVDRGVLLTPIELRSGVFPPTGEASLGNEKSPPIFSLSSPCAARSLIFSPLVISKAAPTFSSSFSPSLFHFPRDEDGVWRRPIAPRRGEARTFLTASNMSPALLLVIRMMTERAVTLALPTFLTARLTARVRPVSLSHIPGEMGAQKDLRGIAASPP